MTIHDLARPATQDRSAAQALRGLCGGAVHLPGDPGFDARAHGLEPRRRPAPGRGGLPGQRRRDVQQVVRAAAAAGLRVAPQSTGHNAGPLRPAGRRGDRPHLGDDARRRSTRSGTRPGSAAARSGCPWSRRRPPHGFAVLHGSSPDVGVAGYSLGGGIFLYARKLGLQTNSITGVEVVTADGTSVRADATRERRAVLGAARRRRQLRHRHGPGVRHLPVRAPRTPGCWSGTAARPSGCCARWVRVGRPTRRTR